MGVGGSKVTITTYTYRIRTQIAVTFGPVDEFIRLDYNSDYKYYNTARSHQSLIFNTSENILFGEFRWGTDSQGDTGQNYWYHGGESLSYKNIAFASFWLDLGQSPSMPATAFTVTRYYVPSLPNSLFWPATTGSSSGMNPAVVLYDLITNPHYGYGLPVEFIHHESFMTACSQLSSEDLSISICISTVELYAIVRSVLDWIDGELVYKEDTGQIGLRLRRKDYTLDQLTIITAEEIRAQTFELQRPSWFATKNVVYVNFLDINRECDQNLVYAEDIGNFNLTGNQRVHEFNFDVFTDPTMAQKVATRQLHKHSYPWAKVSFECFTEKGDTLRVFEPFWLQHVYYGVNAVFRVTEKRREGPNIWKIEAVEESFCVNAAFRPGYEPPTIRPTHADPESLPFGYTLFNSYYRGLHVLGYCSAIMTPEIYAANIVQDSYHVAVEDAETTVSCALIGYVNEETLNHIYIRNTTNHFTDDVSLLDYVLVGNEIVRPHVISGSQNDINLWWETDGKWPPKVINLDQQRGLEGTTVCDHLYGERCYALQGREFSPTNLQKDMTYTMEITPHYMTPIPWWDTDESITFPITWLPLINMPMPPYDLIPGATATPGITSTYQVDITFTWNHASRVAPIPTPCAGLSAYPQTDTGDGLIDQILGWRICYNDLCGMTTLATTYLPLDARSYVSTFDYRSGIGLYMGFSLDVFAQGVRGYDSLPSRYDFK